MYLGSSRYQDFGIIKLQNAKFYLRKLIIISVVNRYIPDILAGLITLVPAGSEIWIPSGKM